MFQSLFHCLLLNFKREEAHSYKHKIGSHKVINCKKQILNNWIKFYEVIMPLSRYASPI